MTYVPLWLIHIVAWLKPTQHFKAIILQLKKILLSQKLGEKKKKGSLPIEKHKEEKKKKSPKIIPFKYNGKNFVMFLSRYLFIHLKIIHCNITLFRNSLNNVI